jgi:hypothetical protein
VAHPPSTRKDRAEALYVVNEPLTVTYRIAINTLALAAPRL